MGRTEERRGHPRAERSVADVHAAIPGSTIKHVDNISCSGVLCRMDSNLPLMEKLLVSLELPGADGNGGADPIECEGVVVRTEAVECERDGPEYQVAIFFTHLDEEVRDRISQYVERNINHG